LKSLGAKSFYPRFCTGTMNHISEDILQHFIYYLWIFRY
jgi:hypothetical protein